MSKFLVKFYHVYPCEEVCFYNLDILKTSGETHKNGRARIREEFNSIIYAACRHHKFYTLGEAITTYNNNSNYWLIEADGCQQAVEEMTKLMSMPAGEEQELSSVERSVFISALKSEFDNKEET